jgi:repressor LexA
MNEKRPSKKQRELLNFIDSFVKGNGYGPSYREVMRALDYRSVSTVAVHINGLIARGLLRKKDNSARSLEVVGGSGDDVHAEHNGSIHEEWFLKEIAKRAKCLEAKGDDSHRQELAVLQEAARILGLGEQARPKV